MDAILTCLMPLGSIREPMRAHLRATYARFERPISSISLLGGFAFDAVTLKRIDSIWEMFWVLAHLVVVAICILIVNRQEHRGADPKKPDKIHVFLISALQFFFGGLLSTFLVLNFRSGSIWVSWPFLLILGAAFVANEKFKHHYSRLYFQLGLFFLSLFCFTLLIVPVILHAIGPTIFLLSGAVSLALLYLFLRLLRSVSNETFAARQWQPITTIATIFVTINILYFLNLIPPIPLSLREASVFHAITRNADGNYAVQAEYPEAFGFFRHSETFHGTSGAPVYAYSAIFSPTSLNTTIVHQWQFYDLKRGWTTMDRIELPVRGGRGDGYRTYSVKTGVTAGAWRVNVETTNGALLGRLRFNMVLQASAPLLVTQLKK
jgi:hypothetical protein